MAADITSPEAAHTAAAAAAALPGESHRRGDDMQPLGLRFGFFSPSTVLQEMPVASHPALGGSGPANQPTGLSDGRLAAATSTLCHHIGWTRQRGEQGLRVDSETSWKMLQRAASNVSDKSKSSKPKVGQHFGGLCLRFFQRTIAFLWEVCWFVSTVDAWNFVEDLHPSYWWVRLVV